MLRDDIRSCVRCELHQSRTQAVPFVGTGPIVIIGEAPGAQEDKLGVPFIGPAGSLLDDALVAAGMSRGEVATMNTICCRPPDNMYARAEDVDAPNLCAPWFDAQLAESKAWVVVLAGAIPFRIVTKRMIASGHSPPSGTITKLRGKAWWFDNRVYIPMFHPSYALRMGGITKDIGLKIIQDLRLAKRVAEGHDVPMADDWGSMEPLTERIVSPVGLPINVFSNVLGEVVTVANEFTQSDFPIWTVRELARLQASPVSMSMLHTIAMVKRMTQCEVI